VHSYLTYLRDRFVLAHELLADTGSLFVQISDENSHRVRMLLDDVFGADNFVATIVVQKAGSTTTDLISNPCDYVLWYARDRSAARFRRLYVLKKFGGDRASKYSSVQLPNGLRRPVGGLTADQRRAARVFRLDAITSQGFRQLTSVPFDFQGKRYDTGPDKNWKTTLEGMARLANAERIVPSTDSLNYVRFLDDFPVFEVTTLWDDVGGIQSRADPKVYVVQTPKRLIERCMLMTTDPGDLVFDPTCGSGTTAIVAEQWGRRWITCDTSRVALSLARQRIMTMRFPYYALRPITNKDEARNPTGGWLTDPTGAIPGKATFKSKSVPHITLKSIARSTALDPIFAKHEGILGERLKNLNHALRDVTPALRQKLAGKLLEKQKREGKKSITDADRRRWNLPGGTGRRHSIPIRSGLRHCRMRSRNIAQLGGARWTKSTAALPRTPTSRSSSTIPTS
jgi:adenine-specific DNA-methyltransferase